MRYSFISPSESVLRVSSTPPASSQFTFIISVVWENVGTAMDVDKEMNGKVCSTDLYVCVDLYASVNRSMTFLELLDQFS